MANKSLITSICIILAISSSILGTSQTDSSIISPIKFPIKLSGTFCELRSNHFHSGIDIKSQRGTWGDSIFAIDDGFISRINISPSGYGRAIYIEHPSGLTSVYAHLQSFTKEVDAHVYRKQLKAQSFGINIELAPNEFPVKRGQFIAKMGSTGYSFGPHLHFEIRNTKTGEYLNPLQYGMGFEDQVAPELKQVVIYHLDKELFSMSNQIYDASNLNNDTIEIDAWRIGLGIRSFDPHNASNLNGIYAVQVSVDEKRIFRFKFDSIDDRVSQYYNAHIDYGLMKEQSLSVHRCYLAPTDLPKGYREAIDQGVIKLYRDKIQKILVESYDHDGNKNSLQFYVRRKEEMNDPIYPTYHKHIHAGTPDTITATDLVVYWSENSLFSNLYCKFSHEDHSSTLAYAPFYQIHEDTEPLKGKIEIMIKPRPIPKKLRNKIQIVSLDEKEGEYSNHGGQWTGEWFATESGQLGTFTILADTAAPTISVVRNTATNYGQIFEFKIEDNLPRGALQYEATLDGKWILAEYDLKKDAVTCRINRRDWSKGPHHFKLLVQDAVSNESAYENRFTFK